MTIGIVLTRSGSPTIEPNAVIPGTGALTIPSGTTAERPSPATEGMIRYNTDTNQFEAYENGAWVDLVAGSGGIGTVTSVGLSSTDLTVSGSPVTTSGTITLNLAVQGGLVPGTYANADVTVNSKGIITSISSGGASTIRLYDENYVSAAPNSVTGQNGFTIGEDNVVSGQDAFAFGVSNLSSALGSGAIGNSANATMPGQLAHAAGKFAVAGDAQGSDFIYRGTSLTQYPIEIFLDGTAARLVLADNAAITFEALVVARRTDAIGDYASFRCEGLIKRDTGPATTAIIGTVNKTIIAKTNTNVDVNFAADTTNGSLFVTIQGDAGQTYRWVIRLITAEQVA